MDEERIAAKMLEMITARGADKSVCPSEVARALAPDDWRRWMGPVRSVAVRLATAGRIEISQRGTTLAPGASLRGAIRLRLPTR